jgi:AcrR family transcriptional regulator
MRERMTADDTRAVLIAALVELLKTRSVETISVRDVAALAGVNHGLVHRYFGSKDELVRAAVRQISAEIHQGDAAGGVSGWSFAYLRANPEFATLVARACLDGTSELLATAAPPPERLDAIVERVRAGLDRAGLGGTVDPHLLNAVATAALLGWFVFRPLLKKGFGLPRDADDRLAALLQLLDQALA